MSKYESKVLQMNAVASRACIRRRSSWCSLAVTGPVQNPVVTLFNV
jgi:hypothetical protein